ncbi:MAG: S8 family serine peptidase, partial [Spirochaetes bacterium]|nr:S8 family serine peptidase [Spirochaetota bacterium]
MSGGAMHVRVHIGIAIIAVAVLMILSGCWSKQSAVDTMFSAEESGELTLNSKMEKFIEKMNWVKVEDDSPERETRSVYRKKGELLVKTRTNREPNIKNIKTRPLSSSGRLIRYDEDSRSFDEIKEMLLKDKSIVKIEPNIIIKSLNYNERDLNNAVFSGDYRHLGKDVRRIKNLMRLGEAGRLKTARRINVGILDTGIDFEHPDLAGNVKGGVNLIYERIAEEKTDGGTFTDEEVDTTEMDYNGHGTKVAGIIGALNNDKGIDGICENVNMYGIKAFNSEGYAYLSDIIEGMQWAVDNNIQVLNLSFGTYEYSSILEDAINDARNSGILIIASAGNDYADDVMYPAKFPDVFAVGSRNENGIVSAFSNWGGDIDIYAPGEDLMSTDIGNEGYSKMSGTSAACAFVTGMAALGLSENLRDVLGAIKNTALKIKSIKNPDGNFFPILNERAYAGLMKSERFRELTLTALGSKRVLYGSGENVDIDFAVQNTGLQRTEATKLLFQFTVGGAVRSMEDIIIPVLLPGGRYSGRYRYKLLPPLPDKFNYISANIIQADQGISYINKFPDGFSFSADDETRALPEVTAFYVTSPDFREDVPRSLVLYISNTGSRPTGELTIKPFSKRAKEEGLSAVPINIIGEDYTISALAPGESVRVRVPLTNFVVPEEGYLSVFAAIYSDGAYLATKYKTYKVEKSGNVKINFLTTAHKYIMDQAVKLLRYQGIYIPDLHGTKNNYFGPDNPIMDTLNLDIDFPESNISTQIIHRGYWKGDHLDAPGFTINYSFLNGHRDEDQIDIVYGQCGSTTWDSHFWIVDDNDSKGRNSAHSAFNKINLLLHGGENLDYGAFGHYRAGHKRAAWYFVGRACHLLADMTVPEHVTEENSHGAEGAAYEGWIEDHVENYGSYMSAAASGGVINPYLTDNPLRFLAYTAAQVGDSFPWASTKTGTTDGANGDREALGDSPHYDFYM